MMEMIGPKPRWEYQKIVLLHELNDDLTQEAEKQNCSRTAAYGQALPDLDKECDPMNVHGWIQNLLDQEEGKLADISEEILRQDRQNLQLLKDTAYRFGYRHAEETEDAQSAYHLLDDVLLNGMPCDDVNEILEVDADHVSWREKQDMHAKYWNKPEIYHEIRRSVIDGLLAVSPFVYSDHDGMQMIERKKASL